MKLYWILWDLENILKEDKTGQNYMFAKHFNGHFTRKNSDDSIKRYILHLHVFENKNNLHSNIYYLPFIIHFHINIYYQIYSQRVDFISLSPFLPHSSISLSITMISLLLRNSTVPLLPPLLLQFSSINLLPILKDAFLSICDWDINKMNSGIFFPTHLRRMLVK